MSSLFCLSLSPSKWFFWKLWDLRTSSPPIWEDYYSRFWPHLLHWSGSPEAQALIICFLILSLFYSRLSQATRTYFTSLIWLVPLLIHTLKPLKQIRWFRSHDWPNILRFKPVNQAHTATSSFRNHSFMKEELHNIPSLMFCESTWRDTASSVWSGMLTLWIAVPNTRKVDFSTGWQIC